VKAPDLHFCSFYILIPPGLVSNKK